MHPKTVLLSLALFLCAHSTLLAQDTPESLTSRFFDIYKSGGSDKALDFLFETNQYATRNQDAIDVLKGKLRDVVTVAGPFWGFDILRKKNAGTNLVMVTLLAKYDRQPLTFRIMLYKPREKWQVQNFYFNTKMDEELEEASKMSNNQ